ncbi:MAG: hypothetical protein RLZZ210_1491 [Pseudomonadota bacterium]|jgi:glutamate-1-semialdehyde 2,1-aminomutase
MNTINNNQILFDQAKQYIPGGVNSPVRAFKAVGGTPLFITKGKGAYIYDANGNEYIDMVGSWGPMIVGHAHDYVLEKTINAMQNGLSFGAPTELEIQFAQRLIKHIPSMEQVRLVSSGTESTMSAIRLARGYTQKELIIKFAGGYHGHADCLLVKAGSGLVTFGHPTSAGVSQSTSQHTIVLDYNDINALEQTFKQYSDNIAAVIIEPVAGNMNLVPATQEFLQKLRDLCTKHNSVLIFDEVMSGFRVALGGAQSIYDIYPDLTCLAKVIGGGMPLAAFGGKKEIMQRLAPVGDVYQAGTLSGNPVAVTAGLATLDLIAEENFFSDLSAKTQYLVDGLISLAKQNNITFSAQSIGGMFGFYFIDKLPNNITDVEKADMELFKKFFHAMLDKGVYLAPSAYEAGFVSSQHSIEVLDVVLEKAGQVFASL